MQNGFKNVKNLAGGYTTYKTVSKDYTEVEVKPEQPERSKPMPMNSQSNVIAVDACGLQCPGPVMKLYEAITAAKEGDVINITATDPGFFADAAAWCARTKNTYVKGEKTGSGFSVWIKKGCDGADCSNVPRMYDDKSMVVFSGELDKALASFIQP
jgi:TusA-related sulfurtransferase